MVFVSRAARIVLFGAITIYILVPMIAVLFYSFSARWTSQLLPDSYTTQHWIDSFRDDRLRNALFRSIALATAVLVFDILIVVPAVYWQRVRNPRIRYLAELMAAIPFALPFVVIAFGILRLFGTTGYDGLIQLGGWLPGPLGEPVAAFGRWLPMNLGTPRLLLFAHAAIAFPFLYWAVDGAMAAANISRLNEAAATCGAGPITILRSIVLPNISAGLAAGGMLVFATSFGEFAIVQVLAGARFENVSLYSLDLLNNTTSQVEKLAVLTIIMFVILFAISTAIVFLNRNNAARIFPGARSLSGEKA